MFERTYDQCGKECDANWNFRDWKVGCRSFTYCPATEACFLKDKVLNINDTLDPSQLTIGRADGCYSNYLSCSIGKFGISYFTQNHFIFNINILD